jgi:hypothetical protein
MQEWAPVAGWVEAAAAVEAVVVVAAVEVGRDRAVKTGDGR